MYKRQGIGSGKGPCPRATSRLLGIFCTENILRLVAVQGLAEVQLIFALTKGQTLVTSEASKMTITLGRFVPDVQPVDKRKKYSTKIPTQVLHFKAPPLYHFGYNNSLFMKC